MNILKPILASLAPRSLRSRVRQWRLRRRLKSNFDYDLARFVEHGCPFRDLDDRGSLLAYVRMLSHALEKGMSLRDARAGFGEEKAREIVASVSAHLQRFGWHDELAPAIGCLDKYIEFRRSRAARMSHLESVVAELRASAAEHAARKSVSAGTLQVRREDIWTHGRRDLSGFFASRHSIRQFSDEPVELNLISRAVVMAQKTPSVCNRQAARVYVFDNDELGADVLACQNGNRGFGHLADKVLVITTDLRQFLSIGERNQCWIDGGMFAMSLIYALHSLGLGTCCLNWSVEREADRRLRSVANISPSENVIMLLAVGHLPEELSVACSERKQLTDVMYVRCAEPDSPGDACETFAAAESVLQSR